MQNLFSFINQFFSIYPKLLICTLSFDKNINENMLIFIKSKRKKIKSVEKISRKWWWMGWKPMLLVWMKTDRSSTNPSLGLIRKSILLIWMKADKSSLKQNIKINYSPFQSCKICVGFIYLFWFEYIDVRILYHDGGSKNQ